MRRRSMLMSAVLVVLVLGAGLISAGATDVLSVTHAKNWGSNGLGAGEFHDPSGVAVDKWGTVYVAGGENGDHRIQRFDSEGSLLGSVGTTVDGSVLLEKPRAVATDRWGFVYVAEKGNGGRVSQFFRDLWSGSHARTWSGDVAPETWMDNLTGIAVGLDQKVYTVEEAQRVQRWSPGGAFLGSWTAGGNPSSVGLSQDGEVFVGDLAGGVVPHSVGAYMPSGDLLHRWGGYGTADGEFQNPYGVSVDGGGNVFVIESTGQRGQVFSAAGEHLATFGSGGSGAEQFSIPYALATGPDRTVYVADTFNHRISKWEVEVPAVAAEVEGGTRYATAVAASQKAFPSPAQSEYAVIATGRNWPDALGGAALAGVLKAPLLLTNPNTLSPEVTAELERLNVQEILVLGGTSAVSEAVYDELATKVGPGDIRRVAGANRFETANEIAEEVVWAKGPSYDGTAFVVTGRNFPDALAISPIAAANGWPIFLTEPGALPSSVKDSMETAGALHGYVIGGTTAVSDDVLAELNSAPFIDYGRLGAANRYATAALLAEEGFDSFGLLWSRPAIATGENFPDALAGGVLQGSDYSVLLLTRSDSLHPEAAQALSDNAQMIYELRFLGGDSALSPAVRASAAALLP